MSQQTAQQDGGTPRPWWREATMWLVVGGPALVVVAGILTLVLALRYPDPVLDEKPAAKTSAAQLPAGKARNHAATGGQQ
ncbi:hypothetical protein [Roseateles violae]|uniref:Nitrogen fixation protein FixH n=1 Tax=Roseateles violae TaxID=3058042 RepID=A0ABT8DY21_9BURK|nr:hypothetical protein [Pelomonas sp. PFR6]MDN3922037.1 hypothetical protein [Pelomonas sp. PFR6]